MKGYKLSFYDNSGNVILLSQYDPVVTENNTLIYNENLTENENNQFNLTFSFSSVVASSLRFPSNLSLINILRIGRKLKLECENHSGTNYIDLIITSISPVGKPSNIIYNINAIDYFSYIFSKNNVGLTLDTIEDEDWLEQNLDSNINSIGNYILRRGNLQKITDYTLDLNITLYEDVNLEWLQKLSFYKKYNNYIKINCNLEQLNIAPTEIVNYSTNVSYTGLNVTINLYETEYITVKLYGYMSGYITKKYVFKIEEDTIKYYVYIVDFVDAIDTNLDIDLIKEIVYIKQYYDSPIYDVDSWKISESLSNPVLWEKINLSVSDSNTYNALIEFCNLTKSLLFINYNSKEINFIDKNFTIFNKNYQLSPDFNLESFSLNYEGSEFYPMLFVEGGTDDYGSIVSIVPYIPYSSLKFLSENIINNPSYDIDITQTLPNNYYTTIWEEGYWISYLVNQDSSSEEYKETIDFINIADKVPYLDSFILRLEYFYNNGLLSLIQYQELLDYFYNQLRKKNIPLKSKWDSKQLIDYEIIKLESEIDVLSSLLPKEENINITQNEIDLKEIFYKEDNTDIIKGSLSLTSINSLSTSLFIEMKFPANFLINTTRNITSDVNGKIWWDTKTLYPEQDIFAYKIYYNGQITWTGKGTFSSSFLKDTYNVTRTWEISYNTTQSPILMLNSPTLLPDANTSNLKTGSLALVIDDYFVFTFYELIEKETLDTSEVYNPAITLLSSLVKYYGQEPNLLNQYKFFENLNRYKGQDYIDKKYNEYKNILIKYINLRNSLSAEIDYYKNELTTLSSSSDEYKEIFSKISSKESILKDYFTWVGSWDYDEINDEFISYNFNYENISWTASGDSSNPILGFIVINPIVNSDTKTIFCDYIEIKLTNSISGVYPSWTFGEESGSFEIYAETDKPYYYDIWNITEINLSDEDWNNYYSDGLENYGKYCYIVKYFEEYNTQYKLEPLYQDYTDNACTQYDAAKLEKDNLMYEIKNNYGQFLYEGFYKNDLEINPVSLYNQAILYSENYKQPSEEYSITYLDISNIIGQDLTSIQVGDKINIINNNLGILEETTNEIQVSSISRNLRMFNGIQLTISRQRNLDYLEKLLLGIAK